MNESSDCEALVNGAGASFCQKCFNREEHVRREKWTMEQRIKEDMKREEVQAFERQIAFERRTYYLTCASQRLREISRWEKSAASLDAKVVSLLYRKELLLWQVKISKSMLKKQKAATKLKVRPSRKRKRERREIEEEIEDDDKGLSYEEIDAERQKDESGVCDKN